MSDKNTAIILHHYDISPFAEKARVLLGMKGLEWYSVEQPVIMPKPELTALTGGYRRIPVMQIGADIYCDTQLIARELQRRFPEPSIHGGVDGGGLGYGVGLWTDRVMFLAAVTVVFGSIGGAIDENFRKDREALLGRPFDTEAMRAMVGPMLEQLRAHLDWIEEQLGDGRSYLMGDAPGLSDASCYHNLAFVRWLDPKAALALLEHLPRTAAWEGRVKGIGHGKRLAMSREEALDIAAASTSIEAAVTDPHEPNGLKAGDKVTVMADDYGRDPIAGEIVSSSAQHVAIKRRDPRVGEVVVHFPRVGFWVVRQ